MASATYQTKLTADTSQHDAALSKSAKQVYNYKKQCDQTDKSVNKTLGAFKKFAGVAGLATIAMKTFRGVLANSTTAADNYGSIMASANRVTEEFQRSIATMDFSNLFNGLGDLISRANEYYNALDKLQTLQISLIGDNAKLNSELEDARRRYKAGDETAADDIRRIGEQMAGNVTAEREALKKELDAYVKNKTSVTVGIHDPDSFLGWGTSGSVNRTAGDFRSMDDIQYLLRHQEALSSAISRAEMEYKNYVRKLEEDGNKIHSNWVHAAQLEAEWKSLKALQEAMGDDEGLQHFEQNYAKYYSIAGDYQRIMTRVDQMLRKEESTGPKSGRTVTVEPVIPEGSIAALEKQIQDLRAQYNLATTDEGDNGRNALKKKIEDAEEELKKLKGEMEDLPAGSLAQWENDLKELKLAWSLATNDADRAKIQEGIDAIQAEIDRINGKVEVPVRPKTPKQELQELIDELRYQMAMADTPELQIKLGFQIDDLEQQMEELDEKLKTPAERIQEKVQKIQDEFEKMGDQCQDACDLISDALNAFANTGDEAANKTLKQAASIVSAFGSAIPKILALVSAQEAEAISGAVASGASLPFPYNIAAIASAVASVMSALAPIVSLMAQANSYATGGIIGGNSHVGDNNIARVNAGEMILNGTQQYRLFRLLNGSIGPQDNNMNGGNVTFHISGSDLVGVLSNNEKRNSRVR